MDADRFDRLVRVVTHGVSRRSLLGSLLATGGSFLGARDTGAACKAGGATCERNSACCSGRCLGNKTCACSQRKPACLQPGNPCKKAVCNTAVKRCVTKPTAAGAPCASDDDRCTKDVCDGQGRCTHQPHLNGTLCPAGVCCGGACVDTDRDGVHCGACNTPCGSTQTCENGECIGGIECPACPGDKVCDQSTGFCRCPATRPVQCEFNSTRCSADPNTDSMRCGLNCFDCAVSFAPGYRCCGGQCVNGCGPSTSGSCQQDPCGSGCQPCTGGKVCCNLGPGTVSGCVAPVGPGGWCPSA